MNLCCTILMNENAGALRSTPGREEIAQACETLGLDAEVLVMKGPDETRQTIQRLVEAKARIVAVAGGDGTVNLAVQALANQETALGVIPQGTANNFANALGLPLELVPALKVLQDGRVRHVDVGKVCGRYFTEAAGVGLFADSLAIYGGSNKNPFRSLYAVLRVILAMRAHRIRLTLDGKVVQERAVFCTVANSYRMAHALPIAPDAKLTDGQLDVVIFGDLGRWELLRYYIALRRKTHLELPKVCTERAGNIAIECRRKMPVHADDSVVCTTPASITCAQGALRVMVPHAPPP